MKRVIAPRPSPSLQADPVEKHSFPERVYALVMRVPAGEVTTYGDVAGALGAPRMARQVGFALAALSPGNVDVPWHRVINHRGCISFRGDDHRGKEQRARLEAEGLRFDDAGRVIDFRQRRFRYEAAWASESSAPSTGA
ncbi:MAG: MGMT family protein [Myxococcota bacterium]